jgi:hypothetical protein
MSTFISKLRAVASVSNSRAAASISNSRGKQPLKELANLKLPPTMTQYNPKFVIGKPILTADALDKAGQACVSLHNYYINNYKSGQDIISVIEGSPLSDGWLLSHLILQSLRPFQPRRVGCLSNALLHIVSPQKLASSIYSIYVLYVCIKFHILPVGTCNNELLIKRERSLLYILTRK